jgi:cytochrome P450
MAEVPRVPGPSFLHTAGWWLTPLPFLDALARRYGDIFVFRVANYRDIVMVRSPELVRQVFTSDPDVLRAGEANEILRPLLGDSSMLLLDGVEHQRQRRLLTPPFMGERMNVYARVMHRSTLAAMRSFPVGRPFSLHPAMQAATLDVILSAVFGLDADQADPRFRAMLIELFQKQPPFILLLLMASKINLPLSPHRQFMSRVAALDRVIYRLIEERRKRGDVAERSDILSLLLAARDEDGQPMTDRELRDELVTLVAAGHETTATSLAWAFQRLLLEPAILERAVAEVETVSPGDNPAAFTKLEYLDAVVKEVLRLRPILPIVARMTHAPYDIGGYTVGPGSIIAPCIYLAHRRAETYPEPERFHPDRWLGRKVDPYAWLPFGGGARRCIGMGFALYEMKIILATVLQRAKLRGTSRRPERAVRRGITLAPSAGAQAVLTRPIAA